MSPAALSKKRRRLPDRPSVIVRGLGGEIRLLNLTAEDVYGWSTKNAFGKKTHSLFQTMFPRPVEEINRQLLADGYWDGELVHTLNDGSKVRVQSHWELESSEGNTTSTVFEINTNYRQLKESRFSLLESAQAELLRALTLLGEKKWWWLSPMLLLLVILAVVFVFTDEFVRMPTGLEP